MKRVVVTGFGIVSSIGNNNKEVTDALRVGRSGIEFSEEYARMGFRSRVCGQIKVDIDSLIDRKYRRFMGESAAFAYLAMREAIEHAGLDEEQVSSLDIGLIAGSGGCSAQNIVASADALRSRGIRKVKSTIVPRVMTSSVSACLAVAYKIKGVSYSISSACATSTHCIGNAYELIQAGKQKMMFAGGGDDVLWETAFVFDSMKALSSKYNDTPDVASRPYDVNRDGFVISGGGGILVLEEMEHALKRKAHIHAELIGYGATSDGDDMVQPSGQGAVRCMQQALSTVDTPIDYINAHATSTPVGDIAELNAIKTVFKDDVPKISATKSLTGHALGAAGVNEVIYSLLMMENDFINASKNIMQLDEGAIGMPIVTARQDGVKMNTIMSNSFGFGGTNATLVLRRPA